MIKSWNNERKGLGDFTLKIVIGFFISIFIAVVFLRVVLPLIVGQEGGLCVGPYKATASVLADATGVNIC